VTAPGGGRLPGRNNSLGTGNDFARGVGIPVDHYSAARLIRTGEPQSVDLIVDDADGVVVNAVHVGAGAEALMRAPSR
jgi:diacylglycerol kinase (ATP)